jgi:hypothetical protein
MRCRADLLGFLSITSKPRPLNYTLNVPPLYAKPCDAFDPCSGETEKSRIPGRRQTAFDDAYLPYYPHSILIEEL